MNYGYSPYCEQLSAKAKGFLAPNYIRGYI